MLNYGGWGWVWLVPGATGIAVAAGVPAGARWALLAALTLAMLFASATCSSCRRARHGRRPRFRSGCWSPTRSWCRP
ncbi:DUF7144 family membrane protein [Amycolatopsis thermoflava]|uniref:DUF7144 family membrane protein n=1 Tax=Amycolatopsis thermoflava TaxID=84480 RepID=UPI003EBC8E30